MAHGPSSPQSPLVALALAALVSAGAGIGAQDRFRAWNHAAAPDPIDPLGSPVLIDHDGDGDLDVLASRVILNQQGDFLELGSAGLYSLFELHDVAADFDGDGRADLIDRRNPWDLGVQLNRVPAGFVRVPIAWQLPTYGYPTSFAAADLDADGDQDLVVGASSGSPGLRVLLNDGTGRLQEQTTTLGPGDIFSHTIALARDFDGDGDADVLSEGFGPSGYELRLYLNDGTGRLTLVTPTPFPSGATRLLGAADLDGDGDPDLFSEGPRLLENTGAGFAVAAVQPLPALPDVHRVETADLDRDGDLDLWVEASSRDRGGAFENLGPGRPFADRRSRSPDVRRDATRVALTDLEGDGWIDVLAVSFGRFTRIGAAGRIEILSGQPNLTFVDRTARLTSAFTHGDFDGDGLLDQLRYDRPDRLTFRKGDATGRFVERDAMPGDTLTQFLTQADLDGDGDLDLVGWPSSTSALGATTFRNDGTGSFQRIQAGLPTHLEHVHRAYPADLDGDGDLDLVAYGDGSVSRSDLWVLRNDGSGTFDLPAAWQIPGLTGQYPVATTFDADGDGDHDIVVATLDCALYLNDGTGRFTLRLNAFPPRYPSTSTRPTELSVGDLDGDGDVDVLAEYYFGATNPRGVQESGTLFQSFGNGAFRVWQVFAPQERWRAAELVDANDDGDLDLLFTSYDPAVSTWWSSPTTVLDNDGRGNFLSTPFGFADPAGLLVGRFVDVDQDGDLDFDNGERIVHNLTRQLRVRNVPRLGGILQAEVAHLPQRSGAVLDALLVVSIAKLPTPVQLPGLGLVVVDPSFALITRTSLQIGTPYSGVQVPVPADPALGGAEVFLQGLVGDTTTTPRVTNALRQVLAF